MFNLIKYNIIGLVALALASACTIYTPSDNQVDNNRYSVSSSFNFDIMPEGQNKLSLTGINGSLHVVGTDEMAVHIAGERIVASDSEEDADHHLDYLRVEVHEYQNFIEVETIQPSTSEGRDYRVNYEIRIPKSWNICFSLANGSATIDSLCGDICSEIINGDLLLFEDSGNLAAGMTNGNITADIVVPDEGFCEIGIVNGNISLTLPKETNAKLHASVVNGTISVGNLTMNDLVQSRHELTGIIGEADAHVDLATVNGTIMVKGK